ncbi:GNAT family acetyltransferase PA5433 [Citrobacter freundii]|uniref:GNAT family acetyltransferase PA5433 n=1 Tax=Citrobacter freundii TaxID=546 RepID=A0A7G2IV73_CITFR|nr:GNAT family acetyltransferase PA5433 [Citrobacter freundii]
MDMSGIFNQFHQPVGMTLSDWKGAPFPQAQQITGRYCKLERINAERHAKELYEAYSEASDCRDWTYLAVGPF